ncbi:MAG: alcohol dehydrogenase catalytic domain-containing protein [Blautia sp.]|nr:alcohol dehydrogenase catalytic domain-containing protein [Blautia sp.]
MSGKKRLMKAVRVEAPGRIHLVQTDIPEPTPGFARIRVKAAAVCATDLEVIDGRIPARYPLIPGHEWSGIVDAVGSPADEARIGKAVIGSNDVVCLTCDACRSGNWRYCEHFEEIGFKRDGAYGEYFLVPVYGLVEKPENLSFEEAALNEPLGVALGSMQKGGAAFGDTLTIFGAGSIGLCILAVGKAMGMRRITVVASSDKRLSIAKELGADRVIATDSEDPEEVLRTYHPGGSDLVVDATGIESCIQASFRIARKGGTVVLAGYGRGRQMSLRIDDVHINNLRVVGAGNNWNMHKKAITLMGDRVIDLRPLVSRTLRPEDYEEGIELVRTRPAGFVKAVFVHE